MTQAAADYELILEKRELSGGDEISPPPMDVGLTWA
jgi:hypothetical protein